MEQLLPIAICNVLPNNVTTVIVELCFFFRQLCGKPLSQLDLDKLESPMIQTLCQLEMLFPSTFFTIMVHVYQLEKFCENTFHLHYNTTH